MRENEYYIDEHDCIRWKSNSRCLMRDTLKMLFEAGNINVLNLKKTEKARQRENRKFLEDYRKNYCGPTEEELAEMRANFEPGTTVVNVITGTTIQL